MKKFMIRVILLVFTGLFLMHNASGTSYAAGAPVSKVDVFGTGEDYTAVLYDSTNGLPTSEANAIVQSKDGFIWLGGYSGFIRYDGTDFYRFDSSLGISSVFSLLVDDKDRVWIGTNENGLAYYDKGVICAYGRVEGMRSHSVRALVQDDNGNILVGTTQGLAYVDAEDLTIHPINDPQVSSEYIVDFAKDSEGNIYGLTIMGAIFKIDNLRVVDFYSPGFFGKQVINTIEADPDTPGIFYLGSQESQILVGDFNDKPYIIRRISTSPLNSVNGILKYGDNIWVSFTNGIGYVDKKNQFHVMEGLPMTSTVNEIMKDSEGDLWFTSTRQGIMKIVPDRFTDVSRQAGLDNMVVNSTCIRSGELYLGTDNGLVILNNRNYDIIENELTEMLKGIRIRAVKRDSQNNIWLATHGDYGLVCYSGDREITCYNSENGLDAGRVRTMMELADGSIAAATGNGLYIIKNGKVKEHYGQSSGISNPEILGVEQGPDGKLYLGSDGDGIYVIDDGKISRMGIESGLTSDVVMRIKWDKDREMFWIITSNSIEYMKDGVITAVTNFPYSNNYDIFFNSRDGAWILSSSGIYVTKASQLIANENIEYSFFNRKSGLPYISTGNSRSWIDENDKLYISGTTGVCTVDIDYDDTVDAEVQLAIPEIEIDDRHVNVSEGADVFIPAGAKKVTIDAYALTYGMGNPRISYYLEGFDEEPISTTKHDLRRVVYTNLDGGKYVFHLNVVDDETGEIQRSETINIVKESSLYESILFWISTTIVSVLIISLIMWNEFRKKTEDLLRKQEEDKQFIDQIMHTFAKCVDLRDTQNQGHSFRVALYTRMLAEKLSDVRGYSKEQIDEFYHIALLHDIGKINIPDRILNKTERLNDEEFLVMKTHAAKGEALLRDVDIVPNLAVGAGFHHERLDGKGYPRGVSGKDIPEVAKVIAVADTFDAMYSTRPYRKQMLLSDVLTELKRVSGTQLDSEVVDALSELADENKLDKEKIDLYIRTVIYGHSKNKEDTDDESAEEIISGLEQGKKGN